MIYKTLDKPDKLWYNTTISRDADCGKGRALRCGCGKIIAYQRDGCLYIKCRGCGHEEKVNITSEP